MNSMESAGAFFEEDLESFNRMFSNMDADFLMHDIFSSGNGDGMSFDTSSWFQPCEANDNVASFLESLFNNNMTTNTSEESSSSMEFYVIDNKSENSMVPVSSYEAIEDIINSKSGNADCAPAEAMNVASSNQLHQLKRMLDSTEDESCDNPKKKSRVSRDTHKSRRKAQPRKKKNNGKNADNDADDQNEITNAGKNLESPGPSTSEDDSNASQELSGAILKSNGKTRASRGSATDPQSLYARRRRERINERLKILQNLVPNGTKVDISTMLEEAVHYVKFLQLQIKLLSSDDLWMYAPIAYNGIDIGVYQRMFPTL